MSAEALDPKTSPVDPPSRGWSRVAAGDKTMIAWTAETTAPPDVPLETPVVLCNGIACSDAYWYGVAPRLAATRLVVRWDYRGHGRSDNPVDRQQIGVASFALDLLRVLDAAGIDRAVLVGHSYGVQVMLEAYRRFPWRIAALVAVAGAAARPLTRGQERETAEGLLVALQRFSESMPALATRTWDVVWHSQAVHLLARLLGGTTAAVPPEIMQQYFAHVRDRDPDLLFEMLREMQSHRTDDILPALAVPLLALAGDRDGLTPLAVLRHMALSAPNGELAVRHGAAHTLPAEHPAWVAGEILRFLAHVPASPTSSGQPTQARAAARGGMQDRNGYRSRLD